MQTNLVNLTSHTINECTSGTTIPLSGIVARAKPMTVKVAEYNCIPVYETVFHGVEGLPEAKENTIYIVSSLCLNLCKEMGRTDCVSPGNTQKDENNNIIGCLGFRV